MSSISVSQVAGHQFRAEIRGHTLVIDQPVAEGGGDAGPTPTELFVAGLVACVAHYARGYLVRHELESAGLAVRAEWNFAHDRPARVGRVRIVIDPPQGLPEGRRAALLAVAERCTVHNSLVQPPTITIGLDDRATGTTA